jgi:hypothetical protein
LLNIRFIGIQFLDSTRGVFRETERPFEPSWIYAGIEDFPGDLLVQGDTGFFALALKI